MSENTEQHEFSLGTSKLYETLTRLVNNKASPVDIVLINMSTILRNCSSNTDVTDKVKEEKQLGKETDYPARQLMLDAKNEINKFNDDIIELMNNNKEAPNPLVVVYFGSYNKYIPQELYRKPPESKRALTEAENMLKQALITKKNVSRVNRVSFVEYPMIDNVLPYTRLIDLVASCPNKHNVAQISHHPLDYHVYKYCSRYSLVQSFTGEILTKNDLANKVFHTPNVSFNPFTHAVLGDKEDIKSSLKPAEKSKLFKIAESGNMGSHTAEWWKEKLEDLHIRIPFKI